MTKIDKLTSEQEEIMIRVKEFWLNYIFSCKNTVINRGTAVAGINWLYKLIGKKEPIIIFLDSPMACQMASAYVKELVKTGFFNRVLIGEQVRNQVWNQVWNQVRNQVGNQVGEQVRNQVGNQVGNQVRDQVREQEKLEWIQFSNQGAYNYNWISFYDFFQQMGIVNHEGFEKYKSILLSGVYDIIQLEGLCIVASLPEKIERNSQGQLHSENGSAIQWKDSYSIHFWNGVAVPAEWIENPEFITKDTITRTSNAEKRRCLREIIGAESYYNMIGGVDLVDEDTDNQGNIMRLYRTKTADKIIGKKVSFLECQCPSTKRIYNIYPPDQMSTNVWQAKASTFNRKQNQFQPQIET